MRIAVLSGKGGTGKTLVSVNLASVMADICESSLYIDCDVEEPNGRLFFKPENVSEIPVSVNIPVADSSLCNGCRKCISICKFNAITMIKNHIKVFDHVCHACGGCSLVCPTKAISEVGHEIGKVEKGKSKGVFVYTGVLNICEESGVPIIRELIDCSKECETKNVVIDCPPGCACGVMESIRDVDYCILVAEPTIFGSHNLNMVYELVSMFGKKFGVVLNKCLDGENPSENFCKEHNINIVGRIPFDKEMGLINSNGEIITRKDDKYKALFVDILDSIKKEVQ